MPDYEEMILARQDERDILEDECNYECEYCPWARTVPVTESRIDLEPRWYCGLFEDE